MDKHIRKIFSVFILGMIVLFIMRLNAGTWSMTNWGLLIIGALVCLLVFRCFVYVFNFSYALACLFGGWWIAVQLPSTVSVLLGGAMSLYGIRLLGFTWARYRSDSYASRVENTQKEDAKLPFPVKIALWAQCAFLYAFHLFAVYLVAVQGVLSATAVTGLIIILAGTVIEGLADAQKQARKALCPQDFVSTGLFARWRHPNYIGEIMVQVGLLVAGIGAVTQGWQDYAAVVIAPSYIILLMIAECGRSDRYMQQRYGDREDFQAYAAKSGSMLPRF